MRLLHDVDRFHIFVVGQQRLPGLLETIMKYDWYSIEKFYKGGSKQFQIRIPSTVTKQEDFDEIMEYIGENTSGGHSEGYRLTRKKLAGKDPELKIERYPADLCEATAEAGEEITFVRKWV